MLRRHLPLLVLVLAPAANASSFLSHPEPGSVQDTVRITERLCRDCRIQAQRVLTLGASEGPGSIGSLSALTRDGRGRYWVASIEDRGVVTVFGPNGAFLRTVGRQGRGPGEFRRIQLLAASQTSVHAFDYSGARRTVFDLDFRVTSTHPLPAQPFSARILDGQAAVYGAIVPTREAIGFTMHLVDSAGRLQRSFGESLLPYREDLRDVFRRTLGPDPDPSRFWAAHFSEYAFESCSAVTLRCRVYLRAVSWFPPHLEVVDPGTGRAPPPFLAAVSSDQPGFLWALVWVPDPNWQRGVDTVGVHGGRVTDVSKYFDTIVERIDLSTNAVVGRVRVDAALSRFVGPSEVYSHRLDDNDVPRIDIMRLAFIVPRKE